MTDDRPFEVLSRTKIRLGPVAKQFAKDYGLTLTDMARYLIDRHYNGDDTVHGQDHESEFGQPRQRGGRADDTGDLRGYEQFPESQNIEDARDDPYLQPPGQRGWWQGRKAEYAVDPQLVFEHENRNQQSPLGNQLGYGSIGHSPSQTPYNGPAPLAPPLSVLRRRGVDELIGDAGYPWLNFQASHYLRTRPQ
jgi:hypothetical protein